MLGQPAFVCWLDSVCHEQILKTLSGNVDTGPQNRPSHSGDVLDSGETLTFDLAKNKGQVALIKSNLLCYVTVYSTACMYATAWRRSALSQRCSSLVTLAQVS